MIFILSLLYHLLNYFGHVSVRSSIPSLFTITWQIITFILSEDFIFFWTHYLFHAPNPWELLLQNQLAVWFASIFFNEKHLFTICLWVFIRIYQTINAHDNKK
ncbi:unnamed protein product [Rotaria sp. Silwood2]|nr:unnamed protein product [Rotaria sp. Silwood2]CAF4050070.1 unnamed protein product [Rotaria sp. Silwood2]